MENNSLNRRSEKPSNDDILVYKIKKVPRVSQENVNGKNMLRKRFPTMMKRLAASSILTGVEYREPVSVSAGILALNYSRLFTSKKRF